MKVERNFNKREARLISTHQPAVYARGALGVMVVLNADGVVEKDHMEIGRLAMHLTPGETLQFAGELIAEARQALRMRGHIE